MKLGHSRLPCSYEARKTNILPISALVAALALVLTAGCTGKVKAARNLWRGDKFFAAGEYDKAEIEYLKALRNQPLNSHAINRLGTMYYEEDHLRRALVYLTKAAELPDQRPEPPAQARPGLANGGKSQGCA